MQSILEGLPGYMMIGIVLVIGVSQVNRILGGLLGIVFWLLVAAVGSIAYDQGVALGVPGIKFPRPVFYALCVLFTVFHGFTAFRAYAQKKQHHRASPIEAGDDD